MEMRRLFKRLCYQDAMDQAQEFCVYQLDAGATYAVSAAQFKRAADLLKQNQIFHTRRTMGLSSLSLSSLTINDPEQLEVFDMLFGEPAETEIITMPVAYPHQAAKRPVPN